MQRFIIGLLGAAAFACATAPAAGAQSAPFTVTSTADSGDADPGDGACANSGDDCTLRAAIEELNTAGDPGTIEFDIPGTGVHTIQPSTLLPPVDVPVTIDGYSQTGAAEGGETSDADIRIFLDGSVVSPGTGAQTYHGIVLGADADGSVIQGLAVGRFRGAALRLGSDENVVRGNYLGVEASGTAAAANRLAGVDIDGTSDNLVGGPEFSDANVISGNILGVGVRDSGGSDNQVDGNVIGLDRTAAARVGGSISGGNGTGVSLENATDDRVVNNVISGNNTAGVSVNDGGQHVVAGNVIGLDVDGATKLGNGLGGVTITDSPGNLVGGDTPGERNIISANNNQGVAITGSASVANEVLGNYVGTDGTGKKPYDDRVAEDQRRFAMYGNGGIGIAIYHAPQTVVGAPDAGNVVSMNGFEVQRSGAGILVSGPDAADAKIQSNIVGLDADASPDTRMGNTGGGIRIAGAPRALIGGSGPGEGNVISDDGFGPVVCCTGLNALDVGVKIEGATAEGTRLEGNLIGTDGTGTTGMGNGHHGVEVGAGVPGTTIGGSSPGAGNVISDSSARVFGSSSFGVLVLGPDTTIQGNLIGTDITGTQRLGNYSCGIVVSDDAARALIGGDSPGARNVISSNGNDGIEIAGDDGVVQGNFVGLDKTGTTALGNAGNGILLAGKNGRAVGNVASGNNAAGIAVSEEAVGSAVEGNLVGTNAAGVAAVPNLGSGIEVRPGATDTTIGGDAPAARNVISGNKNHGVAVFADGTTVLRNLIGADTSGELPLRNLGHGVVVAADNVWVGSPEAGNTIRFNGADGVHVVADKAGVAIVGNSIDDNAQLAIELAAPWPDKETTWNDAIFGPTLNDDGDGDSGGNNLQNFPVLESAVVDAGGTDVRGVLRTLPNATFVVGFYASPAADASGYGEARTYLGSKEVTTDSAGSAAVALHVDAKLKGVVSATATTDAGDTSELSLAVPVKDAAAPGTGTDQPPAGNPGGAGGAPTPPAGGSDPTPNPAGGNPVPIGPSSVQIVDSLLRGLKMAGKSAKLAAVLRAGGHTSTWDAPAAGVAVFEWYERVPANARSARGKTKLVLVARGRVKTGKAGRVKVRVKLTPAGKRALRRAKRSITLTAKASFTMPGRSVAKASRSITLKR